MAERQSSHSRLKAAKMLLDAMDQGDEIPRQIKMGFEIYGRNSTR